MKGPIRSYQAGSRQTLLQALVAEQPQVQGVVGVRHLFRLVMEEIQQALQALAERVAIIPYPQVMVEQTLKEPQAMEVTQGIWS